MSDDMSSFSPSSAGEQGVLRSMQEVAMSSQEASKMLRTYNIGLVGAITTTTSMNWATSAFARILTYRKRASISPNW
ncbi:Biosynthetic arginine decarboxylase [Leclercia adecarboxylata]|uniref:Biosynthetic arginine decarboxylase n=1 Tax=Leclercia adecarboxylata TaxID=83655 RepID=A0A4U9IPZ6_9ENTR|nr:Biosynthetic arginine decarboxylase [Leclercia adecarboxylata]